MGDFEIHTLFKQEPGCRRRAESIQHVDGQIDVDGRKLVSSLYHRVSIVAQLVNRLR